MAKAKKGKGGRARSHVLTVRITTDKAITKSQAQYTLWNHFADHVIYGQADKDDPCEPYGEGKIKINKGRLGGARW